MRIVFLSGGENPPSSREFDWLHYRNYERAPVDSEDVAGPDFELRFHREDCESVTVLRPGCFASEA
ncbi:hypothetical protein MK489_22700 [Myxococcota bacterium]|nr:hypothetical protein [Myxococcota bacterium]